MVLPAPARKGPKRLERLKVCTVQGERGCVYPGGGCSSGGRACVRLRRLLGMSYVAMSEVNLHAQKMLITLNSLPRRPETGNPET